MRGGIAVTIGTQVLYGQLAALDLHGFATPLSIYRQMSVALALVPALVAREIVANMDENEIPTLVDPDLASMQRTLLVAVSERGW